MKEERMKILPPTLREKHRYVKFQIISEEPIAYSDLKYAIWDVALEFYGEHGLSKMSMWLIKNLYDEERQTGVIRSNHKSVAAVIASLGLISRLGDSRVIFKILKVSGTLKGLKIKPA